MKKVAIITGVNSFLGRNVANNLINNNFKVIGILRPESNIKKIRDIKGLDTITIDFNKINLSDFNDIEYEYRIKEKLDKIYEENCEFYFLHFGWGSTLNRSDFNTQMLNVDYSKKVYNIARLLKAKKFIFAGSQAEKTNTTAYGMAKNSFANWAKEQNDDINFIHMRIHSVYGVDDRDSSLILSIIKSIKENKDIALSSLNYYWNYLYIDDFSKIVYNFIENDVVNNIVYDIGSDDTRLLKDYVNEIKIVLKAKNNFLIGSRPNSSEIFSVPNIGFMMNVLKDYKFTKFSEGIKKIYKNYGK